MSYETAVLRAVDLAAGYGDVNVLDGVNIEVRPRTMVTIAGPNGAGKSTLLRTVYGLLRPRAGRVLLGIDGAERDVTGLPPTDLPPLASTTCRSWPTCSRL